MSYSSLSKVGTIAVILSGNHGLLDRCSDWLIANGITVAGILTDDWRSARYASTANIPCRALVCSKQHESVEDCFGTLAHQRNSSLCVIVIGDQECLDATCHQLPSATMVSILVPWQLIVSLDDEPDTASNWQVQGGVGAIPANIAEQTFGARVELYTSSALSSKQTLVTHRELQIGMAEPIASSASRLQSVAFELFQYSLQESVLQRLMLQSQEAAYSHGHLCETLVSRIGRATEIHAGSNAFCSESGGSLSYTELWTAVVKLSDELQAYGVGRGCLIGVAMERDLALPITLLAIMRVGAAYVPLDTSYPEERLRMIVDDARLTAVVVSKEGAFEWTRNMRQFVIDQHGTLRCIGDTAGSSITANADAIAFPFTAKNDDLAYVIYTSGSTGRPKGVMVEHRNVLNFFDGMDQVIPVGERRVFLATTSISFDISVLEMFWSLSRGFSVVFDTRTNSGPVTSTAATKKRRGTEFSLFYFGGSGGSDSGDQYRLLMAGARFADTHGFCAVWTPERHFHEFGGLYPNPAVTGAAVAAVTSHVGVRAGSCVVPLHHPARIVEEWSVVDSLSRGRVGLSFASGWQPDDFILKPENYADRAAIMHQNIDVIRRLWRGETEEFEGPNGPVLTRTLPRPVQAELPFWVTAAGNPDTFRSAGLSGANLLTHLLGQSIDELADKIVLYRKARLEAGHTGQGTVTVMVHAFIDNDADTAREIVREPMKDYLGTSMNLIKHYAGAFPAFRHSSSTGNDDAFANLSDEDRDALLDHAFTRYHDSSALFGTPDDGVRFVKHLKQTGVDEVACLVDFGLGADVVLQHLPLLAQVHQAVNEVPSHSAPVAVHDLIERYGVSHLQCTPSMATLLAGDSHAHASLASLDTMLVGGEALPLSLADELRTLVGGSVLNMYGPTETTIWSTTAELSDRLNPVGDFSPVSSPIGAPIVNTSVHVLDEHRTPVRDGQIGELAIGGAGVSRGYLNRPALTQERFVENLFPQPASTPYWQRRLYLTGDRVCMRDGVLHFVGRVDNQVKIRGHRIEPGEIEKVVEQQSGVLRAIVMAVPDSGGHLALHAHISARDNVTINVDQLKLALSEQLPAIMVPQRFSVHASLPQTPNGKIDRSALAALAIAGVSASHATRLHTNKQGDVQAVFSTAKKGVAANTNDALETDALDTVSTLALSASGAGLPDLDKPALRELVTSIWQRVLQTDHVDPHENFFDAGGSSLLVINILQQLREHIDPAIQLADVFRSPTISTFADTLFDARARTNASNSAKPAELPHDMDKLAPVAHGEAANNERNGALSVESSDNASMSRAARRVKARRASTRRLGST